MSGRLLRIAILCGGSSAEAEVSRQSAAQIEATLVSIGHTTQLIELDTRAIPQLLEFAPEVVFPALHGPPGEDGTVQGLLEMLALPYVGSDVRGSAIAMDKAIAKDVFRRLGLPVANELIIQPDEDVSLAALRVERELGSQVAIKPLRQGSAIGVVLLPEGGDLEKALKEVSRFGPCMVEPFIQGREITAGILELDQVLTPFPLIEITTAPGQWYDYDNRYTPGDSNHELPAQLSPETTKSIQRVALSAHQGLGLRDLSRADFIVDDAEQVTLLEVNTLPGMTPVSLYPEGAEASGYPFEDLLDRLVRQAANR